MSHNIMFSLKKFADLSFDGSAILVIRVAECRVYHVLISYLFDTGIPWILSASWNPLSISNKNVPPALFGLPTKGNEIEWEGFRNAMENSLRDIFNAVDSFAIKDGGSPIHKCLPLCINYSPHASIYMCPKELDYTDFRPNPPNWYHFDTFIRASGESFGIPESLKPLPGRLIYFSMGTIGCAEAGLMKRLVNILGKAPHRFIVSKGVLTK